MHSWIPPQVGDDSVVCAKCSYSVAMGDIMVTTFRGLADKAFDEALADYNHRRRDDEASLGS